LAGPILYIVLGKKLINMENKKMNTFLYLLLYAALTTIVALILKKDWVKLEKLLKNAGEFLAEIVYELGKGAVIAGLIGLYLIPETKDFADAIKYGIIFYAVGFALKK